MAAATANEPAISHANSVPRVVGEQELVKPENETERSARLMEQVMLVGDLRQLTAPQRVHYYKQVCDSVGLNPFTRPFDYIELEGQLRLYAKKDATDQLRALHRVSIVIVSREVVDDVYVVTARASTPDGRTDEAIGAVPISNLYVGAKANALMKSETKAKRRVTLSICGLGWLDETELETVSNVRQVSVSDTGEIAEPASHPVAKHPSTLETFASKAPAAAPEDIARAEHVIKRILPTLETKAEVNTLWKTDDGEALCKRLGGRTTKLGHALGQAFRNRVHAIQTTPQKTEDETPPAPESQPTASAAPATAPVASESKPTFRTPTPPTYESLPETKGLKVGARCIVRDVEFQLTKTPFGMRWSEANPARSEAARG